ncbi:hypothetical protein JQ596_30550 [Bradyrhizobium manausense]|uniref:hypothetical protein n=1 Tax=Bradyrhizobium manausense TaxID=989370 RepID=UPI001BA9D1EB|nr:hypothetical protein [Bradyrhizobium manausense]MBR0829878.1 hypothetical protein [Bradyrhizobium manausense]
MIRLDWLRALGTALAVALLVYAGLGLYGHLAQSLAAPLALVSLDGDLLASDAASRAAEVLHRPASDAKGHAEENKAAQDALVTALKVSPIRPALWLALGALKARSGEPATPALKVSYLTGSVPVEVAFSRVQTVTSTSAATDEEIRLFATSDIRAALASRSRFEAPLVAAYVQATPAGKSLMLEATQATDPAFNATLRRY